MIPVTSANEREWADLCIALWPETTALDILKDRANGKMPYEFLYFVDHDPVAFVSLSLRNDYVEGTDSSPVGYLEGIYVKPNFRGRGIGREMVDFARKWAADHGCIQFASDCELDNEASRLFHGRLGFKEVNRCIFFVVDL